MFENISAEERTDSGDSCALIQQSGHACHDCDGQGSAGALPCGRCAGSGVEPTSKGAAGVLEGIRGDFGAIGVWRSREWLSGLAPLRALRRGLIG